MTCVLSRTLILSAKKLEETPLTTVIQVPSVYPVSIFEEIPRASKPEQTDKQSSLVVPGEIPR